MRTTIISCDNCNRTITKEEVYSVHFSIFYESSVMPPPGEDRVKYLMQRHYNDICSVCFKQMEDLAKNLDNDLCKNKKER